MLLLLYCAGLLIWTLSILSGLSACIFVFFIFRVVDARSFFPASFCLNQVKGKMFNNVLYLIMTGLQLHSRVCEVTFSCEGRS